MLHGFDEYKSRLIALGWIPSAVGLTTSGVKFDPLSLVPSITIVTVCFNSAKTINKTIESVLGQTFENIEYVIIDGGSTDSTVDIIRKYSPHLSYWHSAPDGGISDAFNLGIAAARGKYVAIVNADDWLSPDQIKLAVDTLEKSQSAFAFGDLQVHSAETDDFHTIEGTQDYWVTGYLRMPQINHPTVVVRRDVYEAVGPFNTHRRIAMDYDWHLRADKLGFRGIYVKGLLGHMLSGGVCDRSWAFGLREVRDSAVAEGLPYIPATTTYFWRLLRGKVRRFLAEILPVRVLTFLHRLVNPRYKPANPM